MGLDMYLSGERHFRDAHDPGAPTSRRYDLGYWRKHPNLHGFIVDTFAAGVDDCREIDLPPDAIRQVIAAVESRELPVTTGFFFGVSEDTDEQIAEDVQILRCALDWLETEDEGVRRSVIYRASW